MRNPNNAMPVPASRLVLLAIGLLSATITVLAAARERHEHTDLVPIDSLDVPRYLGAWYEIAKYPNRFQKQCDGYTTAHYSLQPDRTLQVVNRCRRADGRYVEAVGAARQLGRADSPKLEVRFAPGWLSFLPMVWGDYWVIDLDPDYQLAAVSEPKREYLWILSRTPTVPRQAYAALLARLERQGFDLDRLEATRQAR
jgi:apolipoprotein D and lipocalin family protein